MDCKGLSLSYWLKRFALSKTLLGALLVRLTSSSLKYFERLLLLADTLELRVEIFIVIKYNINFIM